MKKIIASLCALTLMVCGAQTTSFLSSSNDIQKQRIAAQKKCLTGNSPESCERLSELYQNEEYLSGDDLALIQAAKEEDWEKIRQVATKRCPENPFACEALAALEQDKDEKKSYQYAKQACDGGSGSACFSCCQCHANRPKK